MAWERARNKDQKEQRIAEIVNAAASLYEKKDFHKITFTMIAKEANFTRSNLYKYFGSKEDIFLEFIKHDLTEWRLDLIQVFDSYEEFSINSFAKVWTETLLKHKRLNNLISILFTHIEKNSSLDRLLLFKEKFRAELRIISKKIILFFPMLTIEKVLEFLRLQLAISIGLFSMTNLSEIQEKVFEKQEYSFMKIDLQRHMKIAIEHLFTGVIVSY
ncbi:TetR family transcriptional regulator [bacterium]|nr:TetR family transcriptional regulator [bacterium]